ncbi:MAG: phosphatidate cytidylyltransferase [Chitinophagales bacterium]
MLRTRIISAIIGIPLLLLLTWVGGTCWLVLSGILALGGLIEIYRGASNLGQKPLWIPGLLLTLWAFLLPYKLELDEITLAVIIVITVIIVVLSYPRYHILDIAITWTGAIFMGLFMGYISLLGSFPDHFRVLLMTFLLTWSGDTGAYFVGTWWGKNKLSPELSPGKTWEGLAGGMILTMIVAQFGVYLIPGYNAAEYAIIGLGAGLLGAAGDLFASAIKRGFGIKDFGHIIPGHGGIMDRFDSFILVAPLIYYLARGV